jgi:hydrogenase-4 component E
MMLLGLLALVTRKGMYGQIIGFLLMENGIFTFGLTLTGGMPLLVELGVFFDVTIGSVLMAALSYRVQKEHDTVVTDRLSELVD